MAFFIIIAPLCNGGNLGSDSPHVITWFKDGKRYLNESASYVDVVHAMLERKEKAVPSGLILESRIATVIYLGWQCRVQPRKST